MAVGGLHQQAMAEVRWRSFWRDDGKTAARSLGISRSHLTSLRNGTARMTSATARRILAAAREEELQLADKIERELNSHWHKEAAEIRREQARRQQAARDAVA